MKKITNKKKKKAINVLRLKSKSKEIKKPREPRKDPRIEEIYEQEVVFKCPTRGLVKQIVKIKRYKTMGEQGVLEQKLIKDSFDDLEKADDGLSIYNDGEDLGISDDKSIEE